MDLFPQTVLKGLPLAQAMDHPDGSFAHNLGLTRHSTIYIYIERERGIHICI